MTTLSVMMRHQTLLYTADSRPVWREGCLAYVPENSVSDAPIPLKENVCARAAAMVAVGYAM